MPATDFDFLPGLWKVANRKLALINDAYDRLRRERGQQAA